jgi:hypothetical protein
VRWVLGGGKGRRMVDEGDRKGEIGGRGRERKWRECEESE